MTEYSPAKTGEYPRLLKLYHWIVQFKSFHWLSHHGLCAIIPCSAKIVSKRVIFGALLFLVSSNFLYFGAVLNKTIIPFALVGYEIGYSQLGPTSLGGYLQSHIQCSLME